MVKATLTLRNGTILTVEGVDEEVKRLIAFYDSAASRTEERKAAVPVAGETGIATIVNAIKSCDDAEHIEKNILDKANEANRALLPLYVLYRSHPESPGLTTGEISAVTKELGVLVSSQHVWRAIRRASKLVFGDTLNKPGVPVRYKLNRRGADHIRRVIAGEATSP